jgi:hypothetical protein
LEDDQFPFARFFAGGGAVPEVDPADLESVLELCGGIQPTEDQPKSTDWSICEQVCTSGADVVSVAYRVSMLQMCAHLNVLSPWLDNGLLDKAVIRVAARFQMEKMVFGEVRNSLPFDVEEFVKQVEAEIQISRREQGA